MRRARRSRAAAFAAAVFVIVFVASFDHTALATRTFTPPTEPIDDPAVAVDRTAGSIVFVLSIVAVLIIGAFVVLKARRHRSW